MRVSMIPCSWVPPPINPYRTHERLYEEVQYLQPQIVQLDIWYNFGEQIRINKSVYVTFML